MAEVIFIFNGQQTVIQCSTDEKMKDIYKRYSVKINIDINGVYFLYNGASINLESTFNEIASKNDKNENKMKVLVYSHSNDNNNNENASFIKSPEIIGPKCGENCLIDFKDYKIKLHDCKNGHNLDNILFDEYNKTQKIDLSKIICDDCKNKNKNNTFNNKFFKCLSCNNNICPLCKMTHNNEHEIIDYEEKNYKCKIHNENFTSFCDECKQNLCLVCESEHEDKNNIISFKDIIPKKKYY